MAIAPTSIKALVLPAGDSDTRYDIIKTVRTEIKPPLSRPLIFAPIFKVLQMVFSICHMIRTYDDNVPQPNVSLLPDVRDRWDDEAWEERAVLGTRRYHIFFTRSRSEFLEHNRHTRYSTWGDVFILKLSDAKDENGRRFYVDLEPCHLSEKKVQKLARTVPRNVAYWGGKWH